MEIQSLPYVVLLWSITPLGLILATRLWSARHKQTVKALIVTIIIASCWTTLYSFELLASELEWKLFWAACQYPFIGALPVAWLTFSCLLSGAKRYTRLPVITALLIFPLSLNFLFLHETSRQLIWRSYELIESHPFLILDVSYGPLFWVFNAYCITLIALGTLSLLNLALFSDRVAFGLRATLMATPIFPIVANLNYTLGHNILSNLDLTPFAFLPSGLLMTHALLNHHLPNVALLAKESVFEELPEAIFILNENSRIIDANLAASRLTGMSSEQLNDNTIGYALELTNDIINTENDEEIINEIQITLPEFGTKVYLHIKNTHFKDSNEEYCGQIVVITATTNREVNSEANLLENVNSKSAA